MNNKTKNVKVRAFDHPVTFTKSKKINFLVLMRFLSFLAHASSLCNISSMFLRGTGKYLPVTRNKMLSVRADESDENMGQFYKLVPVSQEEASKSTDKNIISYEYIKVDIKIKDNLIFFLHFLEIRK